MARRGVLHFAALARRFSGMRLAIRCSMNLDTKRHLLDALQALQAAAAFWTLMQTTSEATMRSDADSVLEEAARQFVRAEKISWAEAQLVARGAVRP